MNKTIHLVSRVEKKIELESGERLNNNQLGVQKNGELEGGYELNGQLNGQRESMRC